MAEPTRMSGIDWEPCPLVARPDPELRKFVRSRVGFVPDYLDFLSPCPWVTRQVVHWDTTGAPLLSLPQSLAEMISLVVAQDNSCRYCYAATTVMLRALGFGDATIGGLEQHVTAAALSPAIHAALDVARRLSRANPLVRPDALAALRQHGYDDDGIREVVYLAALMVIANRVVTIAAVPVDGVERLSRRWWLWLLGPVLTLLARRARRRATRTPLPPAMREGPFRDVVRAFDGHPLGPRLWTQLDEAWTSDILPRRTKALIVGVVGRALGCERSETEARRLLAMDDVALDLDVVLTHLSSPELTEAEAAIVPFVRETTHYTPAQIQRHGRVVFERLGQAAFVETVGIAALANAFCRMSAALGDAGP